MSSSLKICQKCGVPVEAGLANCKNCGAQVGTVFSETAPVPPSRLGLRSKRNDQINRFHNIEHAQAVANNSLVLALTSFFCPGIGLILGIIAIIFGIKALRLLNKYGIEEGRGHALAGIIISAFGFFAQLCYGIYIVKQGLPI